jgi:hypothetical protein
MGLTLNWAWVNRLKWAIRLCLALSSEPSAEDVAPRNRLAPRANEVSRRVSQARFLDSGEDASARNDDIYWVRVGILSGQAYSCAFAALCRIRGKAGSLTSQTAALY